MQGNSAERIREEERGVEEEEEEEEEESREERFERLRRTANELGVGEEAAELIRQSYEGVSPPACLPCPLCPLCPLFDCFDCCAAKPLRRGEGCAA